MKLKIVLHIQLLPKTVRIWIFTKPTHTTIHRDKRRAVFRSPLVPQPSLPAGPPDREPKWSKPQCFLLQSQPLSYETTPSISNITFHLPWVYRRWKEGEGQEYRSDLKLLCNDRPKMNIESEQQMQASVISWVVTVSSEWSDRKWEQME